MVVSFATVGSQLYHSSYKLICFLIVEASVCLNSTLSNSRSSNTNNITAYGIKTILFSHHLWILIVIIGMSRTA